MVLQNFRSVRLKFNPDLDYMTPAELQYFRNMREIGDITFFRCALCETCGTEILKGKRFCSKPCKEKKMSEWKWTIDVKAMFGKEVKVETKDGMYLGGRLTNLITELIRFCGKEVEVPIVLELDGDPEKRVDVSRLVGVDLMGEDHATE